MRHWITTTRATVKERSAALLIKWLNSIVIALCEVVVKWRHRKRERKVANNVSIPSLEAEAEIALKVLSDRSAEDQALFTEILAEVSSAVSAEAESAESKIKPLWSAAFVAAWHTFTTVKLSPEEIAEVERLTGEIKKAEKSAESAALKAGEKESEEQFKALSAATPTERQALWANGFAEVERVKAEAAAPHLASAAESAALKWTIESRKSRESMEEFRKPLKGSGKTVHKKLTISFSGVWLTSLAEAHGSFCYIVSSGALYHRASGDKLYKLLGKYTALKSATALQRFCCAIVDDSETDYSYDDLESQKSAFALVKERFESVEKIDDLKQWGNGKGGWKDQGGSDRTRHLTYSVKDANYDVGAEEWVKEQQSLPKPLTQALDLSKPQQSAAESAEVSAAAQERASK